MCKPINILLGLLLALMLSVWIFKSTAYALVFAPQIPEVQISFTRPIWQWRGAPDWKNERLKQIQEILYTQNFSNKEIKALVLMGIQESGLNFNALGDTGCSEGIWQRNRCVHGANPYNFNTVEGNVSYISKRMKYFFDTYSHDLAIVAHNCPSCAQSNYINSYLNEVMRHEKNIYELGNT